MKLSIGSDHAGFRLKELLRVKLEADGHQVTDRGAASEESCDYPDFASAVGRDVSAGACERGILVCGTGIGMSIAANKIDGVRAATATVEEQARLAREHNDANVLTLGARILSAPEAERLIDTFLHTEFQGGRHARRVELITRLERND